MCVGCVGTFGGVIVGVVIDGGLYDLLSIILCGGWYGGELFCKVTHIG